MDLVSDDLWEAIEPLLPPEPLRQHGGPPRICHRAALGGILFVLRHGLRWRDLPVELGFGSGVTCWRRLRQWQDLGIWAAAHQVVLTWLGDRDVIDGSRASLDSLSVRAKRGGEQTGPNPTDRGKAGRTYHLLVDRLGVPLAVQLTAANVLDSKMLEPLVDAVPPSRRPTGQSGRPRKRPAKLHADKGYDYAEQRRALRRRGITPRIARRGVESSERLGRFRWVVERSLAWVVAFRKLAIRYDRHEATVLACWRACTSPVRSSVCAPSPTPRPPLADPCSSASRVCSWRVWASVGGWAPVVPVHRGPAHRGEDATSGTDGHPLLG